MTVAGLPGIPGKAALVGALDMFIADSLLESKAAQVTGSPQEEVCGIFLYRHQYPNIIHAGDAFTVEWVGEIDWVRLDNVAADPATGFEFRSTELQLLLEQELESLKAICQQSQTATSGAGPTPKDLYLAGFSPLVGTGHSHPGGTVLPSGADHALGANTAQWRRAAAPQTVMGKDSDAQFYEADFLFAIHDLQDGKGSLVHFKDGSTRGTWEGNFLPPLD